MASNMLRVSTENKQCAVCGISCQRACTKCKKVNYCGVIHQREDWNTHRPNCFPVLEKQNAELGRFLVTTRSISAGAAVFTEPALCAAPFRSVARFFPICLGCCKLLPGEIDDFNASQRCPDCSWILCKPDCEQKHWHADFECGIFASVGFKVSELLVQARNGNICMQNIKMRINRMIQVLRILMLKNRDPVKWEVILNLEDNNAARKGNLHDVFENNIVVYFIHSVCKFSPVEYPYDLISHVYGVALTNSIGMAMDDETKPGAICQYSIYEKSSKVAHSCVRNTFKNLDFGEEWKQTVFASVDIQEGDILYESYTRHATRWKGFPERRQFLKHHYHFWCKCIRCSDPTELGTYSSAIGCTKILKGNSQCPGFYIPMKNGTLGRLGVTCAPDENQYKIWQCTHDKCKSTEPYERTLEYIYLQAERDVEHANTFDRKISLLEGHERDPVLLHENHVLLMRLRFEMLPLMMSKCCSSLTSPHSRKLIGEKMEKFAKKCLLVDDKFHPGKSIERGQLMYYLAFAIDMQYLRQLREEEVSDEEYEAWMTALENHHSIIVDAMEIVRMSPNETDWKYIHLRSMLNRNLRLRGIPDVERVN